MRLPGRSPHPVLLRERTVLILLGALLLAACTQPPAITGTSSPNPTVNDQLPSQSSVIEYSTPPENIRFTHLGIENGLSQSVIRCILQDSHGYMWFGTEDGLNRYDGYNFVTYRPDPGNPRSINDIWINTLFEDSSGNIWIGTRQGGLNRYDPATGLFSHYVNDPLVQNTLISDTVNAIQEDNRGFLWIGTDQGLDRFDQETGGFKHFFISPPEIDAPLIDNITTIFKASDGILWVGTADNGLKRFHPTTGSYQSFNYDPMASTTISDNHINAIQQDRNGSLWIATQKGLNLFDQETQIFFRYQNSSAPGSLLDDNVNSVYLDRSGTLWVGTASGLDRFERTSRTFSHYRHDPASQTSLSNDTVLSIFEDRGGILWIGTYGGSINLYDHAQDAFQYYYHRANDDRSLSGNIIFPIFVDPTGLVWIGTYNNGLNRFDPQRGDFQVFKNEPGNPASLQSNSIGAILMDKDGFLWVGTATGLDRFDPRTGVFQHFVNIPGDSTSLTRGNVQALLQDHLGNLWVGTQQGLNRFIPETGSFYRYLHTSNNSSSISNNDISTIMEDRIYQIWIGTFRGGLNRLNPRSNTITTYQHDPNDRISLGNNSVLDVYQDAHGTLWIGTAGGGLSRYDDETETFDNYTTSNGLPNNVVYGILEDDLGYLWLSTNFGLSRFDPIYQTFRNFTASDGLQGNQFNRNAFARGISGEMYFGGVQGLTVFSPVEIRRNTYVPPVVVSSLTRNGESLVPDLPSDQIAAITLHYPENGFEFEFTALSYAQPQKNQYAYMLDDFDPGWFYAGTERNGRYTNLPGGTYTLRLKAASSDGTWNETGIGVQVVVVPAFWQTLWFQGLVALSLLSIAVIIYRARMVSIQNRSHELERLVRERTAALEKRGQEMEALYSADGKMLRTQTLDQVYHTLVIVAEEMLQADKSAVLTWNDKQTHLSVRVSRGFTSTTLQLMRYARGEGLVGHAALTGEPIIVTDLDSDSRQSELKPETHAAILAEGISSFLILPIKINELIIGVYIVAFTQPSTFNEDTVRLFSSLVQRAALSVENAMLFEQTKELAIMEERNRLARDLHDSAKQKAFAALAQLGTANGMLKDEGRTARSHLEEAENLVYEVIQELTFLIQEIHPSALKEKGLASMLREYVFQWESRNDAEISLKIENERRLPLEIEQAFYRIIQEALANITRHSCASHVDILLSYNSEVIQASVSDNGCGFDVTMKSSGLGLRSIRERIESIGGSCQIDSAPNQGTRLKVQAPIEYPEM